MSKLKFCVVIIVMMFCNTVFSQNERYIFIRDINSEEVEYHFTPNFESASFYIYNKGFETKKLRDSIKNAELKKQKENVHRSLKAPVYTGVNFIALKPPVKIASLEGITTISPKDYREHQFKGTSSRNTYIIHPCEEGGYYKWMVTMLGNK